VQKLSKDYSVYWCFLRDIIFIHNLLNV
jgi:hypothetical protein